MRAAAFLLDAVILVAAAVAVTIVALFGLGGLGLAALEPLFIGWIVLIFLLRNVYFIAFEASRRAATPGKRIVGIRVVSRAGAGLSIDQVIARNLMREIEVFLPLSMIAGRSGLGVADTLTTVFGLIWALLFAFFPLFNRDRMRIGDLLAGTWVVEAPRRALAEDLSARTGRRRVSPSARSSSTPMASPSCTSWRKCCAATTTGRCRRWPKRSRARSAGADRRAMRVHS